MFWCVEVMISIPGVVVHFYHTNDPLFEWEQLNVEPVPFEQVDYYFDPYAFIKLIRRLIFAVINITISIYFVNTLERED